MLLSCLSVGIKSFQLVISPLSPLSMLGRRLVGCLGCVQFWAPRVCGIPLHTQAQALQRKERDGGKFRNIDPSRCVGMRNATPRILAKTNHNIERGERGGNTRGGCLVLSLAEEDSESKRSESCALKGLFTGFKQPSYGNLRSGPS